MGLRPFSFLLVSAIWLILPAHAAVSRAIRYYLSAIRKEYGVEWLVFLSFSEGHLPHMSLRGIRGSFGRLSKSVALPCLDGTCHGSLHE